MIRRITIFLVCFCVGLPPLSAQEMTGVARVDVAQSEIRQGWLGKLDITLTLSQGIPFRVFTLADPPRLVLDFRTVDWSGIRASDLWSGADGLTDLRFGNFRPGWSRLVADLAKPMLPDDIGITIDDATGKAVLNISMAKAKLAEFTARSGAPGGALWPQQQNPGRIAPLTDERFVVAIDPGHGGVDPGAQRETIVEKDLMLRIAIELRDALLRSGVSEVVLTRDSDIFVSLAGRVAHAHRAGADIFISLHADALDDGGAEGATVYTLSEAASDTATAHLAARHNKADVIAGTDLTGSQDGVASVLLDLARQETEPRTAALASALVRGMRDAGGPMNSRPLRRADFLVLKSADIPSVLVEVGFLSSARDLDNLLDPIWRAEIISGMVKSILTWRDMDAAKRPLMRR